MRRLGWSKAAAVCAGVSLLATASVARASSGIDSPESGVEQVGRGSAWLARADDPLAAYYNPAALAFQATGVHLGAQLMFAKKCYTRTTIDPTTKKEVAVPPETSVPAPLLPGQKQPADGSLLPSDTLCAETNGFPNPQLGAVFRITDKIAIGLALVAPHSAGKSKWGESLPYVRALPNGQKFFFTQPAPQRYLLTESDALIINPTLSIAFAPTDYLSFGAGFVWGIATASFVNFSEAKSTDFYGDHAANDVRAELKTKDLFIPGFVLGGLWSATKNLDVAAWFKWQDSLKGTADLKLESLYWKASGVRNTTPCGGMDANGKPLAKDCNITTADGAGTVKLNIPMEAKIGLRYHYVRQNQGKKPKWADKPDHPNRRVRDPLSEDLFDVEVDFTWANNSAVQDLELQFNSGIVIKDGSAGGVGEVPKNGNIPHNWKDVFGVRLGGDYVVLPGRFALRTGGFFEMKGQDDEHLALDFDLGFKAGISGGAKVRVGPVDISVGYQHTFFGTINNNGKGAIHALSGDATGLSPAEPGATPVCGNDPKNPKVGPGCFRSYQTVNGGKLTAQLNEVGISATARF
jgi:long-subunit fatty acid transport protein